MIDITYLNAENLGGINYIEVIPVADVVLIADAVNGIVSSAITLAADKRFYKWQVTQGTAQFTENPIEDARGTVYQKTVSAIIAKDRATILDMFTQMKNDRFILKYTDNNGDKKIVGSIEEPLSFKYTLNTQTDPAGRNSYLVQFNCDASKPSPFYVI